MRRCLTSMRETNYIARHPTIQIIQHQSTEQSMRTKLKHMLADVEKEEEMPNQIHSNVLKIAHDDDMKIKIK